MALQLGRWIVLQLRSSQPFAAGTIAIYIYIYLSNLQYYSARFVTTLQMSAVFYLFVLSAEKQN